MLNCLKQLYLLIFQEYYKADLISDIWREHRRMGRISFNVISLWDVSMILVFISGHLFQYGKYLNLIIGYFPYSHACIQSCCQLCRSWQFGLIFLFGYVFFSFLAGGRERLTSKEMKCQREKLFSGFLEYKCARHTIKYLWYSAFFLCSF